MSNTRTSGRYSYAAKDRQWAAYDSLPPTIREALQNAAFDWAPYSVKQHFERGNEGAKNFVRHIRQWDLQQIERDRKRVWGIRS